jgi:hypothetical protein
LGARVKLLTHSALSLKTHPELQALYVKYVFALWKLLEPVVTSEIVEANVAPDYASLDHAAVVRDHFDFVEVLRV